MSKPRLTCMVLLAVTAISQQSQAANKVLKLIGEAESFFEAPDHEDFDLVVGLTPFTFEAWVMPTVLVGENIVINKEDSFEFAVVDGFFDTAIQPVEQGWVWHHSATEVPIDEWTHLAVTWDFDTIDMYVNGEWVAESPLEGSGANNSPDTLKIGRRVRGDETHSSFEGFVDEVRVSSILRYEREGFPIPTAAFTPDEFTLALYHFDEEVPTGFSPRTILDESLIANHGRLLGQAELVEDDFLMSGTIDPDFNDDGAIDNLDVDALVSSIAAGDNPSQLDLNGDGSVSGPDLDQWLEDAASANGFAAPYLFGDANLDGSVDAGDLNALALSWQDSVASWSGGDFTADGIVDAGDLNLLALNWQDSIPVAAAVPEPNCFAMLGFAIVWIGCMWRTCS